jgi:hypothetical protein
MLRWMPAICAVALLVEPAHGETWFGSAKMIAGCHDETPLKGTIPVIVSMPAGASFGSMEISGSLVEDAPSDRIPAFNGKGELFAISSSSELVVISVSGTIKGRTLKGNLLMHNKADGCIISGKVKARH